MTVQELIEQLQNFPKDMLVVVDGYEGGCNDVSELEEYGVDLNVNREWFYGAHEPNTNGPVRVLWVAGYNHNAN
jgi:hypothetical protein